MGPRGQSCIFSLRHSGKGRIIDRNQISGCQGLRVGVRGLTVKGFAETLGGDGEIPHLILETPVDRGSWWATVHRDVKTRLK